MSSSLFRDKAVSAIDSVERFDEAIVVISARSIAALVAILVLIAALLVWAFLGRVPVGVQGRGVVLAGAGIRHVLARTDGTIVTISHAAGDALHRGDMLVRMRTVAGDIVTLRAPISGNLIEAPRETSSFVQRGETVASVEPFGSAPEAVIFVPVDTDRPIVPGMSVRLSPADARPDVFGFVRAHVIAAAPYPASVQRIKTALQDDAVAASFAASTPVREVHVTLDRDADGRLVWSGLRNAGRAVAPGTPCTATVVSEERRPITFILPQTRE